MPNLVSVSQMICESAEWRTHTHTDGTNFIPSTADAEGKNTDNATLVWLTCQFCMVILKLVHLIKDQRSCTYLNACMSRCFKDAALSSIHMYNVMAEIHAFSLPVWSWAMFARRRPLLSSVLSFVTVTKVLHYFNVMIFSFACTTLLSPCKGWDLSIILSHESVTTNDRWVVIVKWSVPLFVMQWSYRLTYCIHSKISTYTYIQTGHANIPVSTKFAGYAGHHYHNISPWIN